MKVQEQLKELEAVAEKKGVKVSYESLGGESGAGGLCKVKGQYRVLIDKRAADGDKVTVLATALAKIDVEDIFMSEQLRALIDRHKKKPLTPPPST